MLQYRGRFPGGLLNLPFWFDRAVFFSRRLGLGCWLIWRQGWVKLETRIAFFDGDVYILYVPKIAQNLRLGLLVALLEPGPNTAYDR